MLNVYCPSKGRPNAPLFEFSDIPINIILQFKEDIDPYNEANENRKVKHNIEYIPELKGLLDARNYILNLNNEWSIMIDDDINSCFKRTKGDDYKISFSELINETESVLYLLDKNKVGLVGYNRTGFFFRKKDKPRYIICNKGIFCSIVVLNNSLLKLKNIKYDAYEGQKAYGEDIDIHCQCVNNNIERIIINSVIPNRLDNLKSQVWENVDRQIKGRESIEWLLKKWCNNKKVIDLLKYHFGLKKGANNFEKFTEEQFNKILNVNKSFNFGWVHNGCI
jgi:predicted CopG family antitoxin